MTVDFFALLSAAGIGFGLSLLFSPSPPTVTMVICRCGRVTVWRVPSDLNPKIEQDSRPCCHEGTEP